MTHGHRRAQDLFAELGQALHYPTQRTYSKRWPTDGVWSARGVSRCQDRVPLAAIEVVVSESSKTMKGSLLTLEKVSPAVGILLVHEEEIRRRLIRAGMKSETANARVAAVRDRALALAAESRQRIEVWTYAGLVRRHHEITSASPVRRAA